MTSTSFDLGFLKKMLSDGIRDELCKRSSLSKEKLKDFSVELVKEVGKLRLSFPSDSTILKLNDADERAFQTAFNEWAGQFTPVPDTTFLVTTNAVASNGLRKIECTALKPIDLIRGVNQTLDTNNQVDASMLGSGHNR